LDVDTAAFFFQDIQTVRQALTKDSSQATARAQGSLKLQPTSVSYLTTSSCALSDYHHDPTIQNLFATREIQSIPRRCFNAEDAEVSTEERGGGFSLHCYLPTSSWPAKIFAERGPLSPRVPNRTPATRGLGGPRSFGCGFAALSSLRSFVVSTAFLRVTPSIVARWLAQS